MEICIQLVALRLAYILIPAKHEVYEGRSIRHVILRTPVMQIRLTSQCVLQTASVNKCMLIGIFTFLLRSFERVWNVS